MTMRSDPLGLLDGIRRDVERLVGIARGLRGNPSSIEASNPQAVEPAQVALPPMPLEFNGDMMALLERKREEWLAAGIRPGLVRMGLDQAVTGAQGMARRMEMFAQEVDKPAVMQDYIENVADAWVRAMANGDEVRHADAL